MANTFSIILTITTIITGLLWYLDKYVCTLKQLKCQVGLPDTAAINTNKEILKTVSLKHSWIEIGASIFPVLAFVLTIRSFVYEPFQIPSGSMMPTLLTGDFIIVEKFAYNIKDPIFQKTLIEISHAKRGDIVVFKYPENPRLNYIKRVIGLPGDKVTYDPVMKEITIQPSCTASITCNNTLHIAYTKGELSDFMQHIIYNNDVEITSNSFWLSRDESKKNGIHLIDRKETLGNVTYHILTIPLIQDQLDLYYRQQNQPIATWIVPPNNYFVMGDNRDNSADSRYWGFVPKDNLLGKATAIWMSLEKQEDEWPTSVRLNRIGRIN